MDFKTPFDSPQLLCEMHYDQICDILSQYKGPVDSKMLEEWIIAVSQILCVNRNSRFRAEFQRILRQRAKGVLRGQIIDGSEILNRSVSRDDRSSPCSIASTQSSENKDRKAPPYFVEFFETQCVSGYDGWSTSIADLCIAYENWRPMNCAPSMGKCQIGAALVLLGITKHITKGKTHYNVKLRTT